MKKAPHLAAAFVLATLATVAIAEMPLTKYSSPDRTFTVLFPGTPSVSSPVIERMPDGTPVTERNYAVIDDADYLVTTFDYPGDVVRPGWKATAASFANDCGGTYTMRNSESYQGHPAALYQASCPANTDHGAEVMFDQAVLSGNRLYQVVYVTYGSAIIHPDRSSTFLNSLHIN